MRYLTAIFFYCLFGLTATSQDSFVETYSHALDLIKAHEYTEAITVLDKAYDIAEPKSQDRSRAVWAKGMALYFMAENLQMAKDYDAAYPKYAESLTCFRRIGRDKDVMDCAKSMAVLNATHFGFNKLALEQYEYALGLAKALDNVEEQAGILLSMIAVHRTLHNESEVVRYTARLDSLMSNQTRMAAYPNLFLDQGNRAFQNGDWEVAIGCYKRFLTTEPKEEKRFSALLKLRDAYDKTGEADSALVYSTRTVEDWKKAFEDNPQQRYVIYRNHFLFQLRAGDYAGALASIDSVAQSVSATGTDFAKGELHIERGRVYSLMGRWNESIRNFELADSLISASPLTTAVRGRKETLVPLYAGALHNGGRYEESCRQYRRYLDLMKAVYGDKSMEAATALRYLANIEAMAGRLTEGTRLYIQSWVTARDIAVQDLRYLPANARGHYWSELNDLMWDMIPYGIAAGCSEDDFTASAYEALMFSKGLLLAAEKSVGKQVQKSADPRIIADYTAVADLRKEIERLRADGRGDDIVEVYARMDSLDRALTFRLMEKGVSPAVSTPTVAEIIDCLDDKTAVVDFADFVKTDGSHVYAAFVLRKGMRSPRLLKVFEQASLDSLIASNNGKYTDLYEDYNSAEMYNIILEPLMAELKGVDRIYFVPSGILNQIAVEAIRLTDGTILGDRYDIVRLTNSKEILDYDRNSRLRDFRTAWLFGGLEYDVDGPTMAACAGETDVPLHPVLRRGIAGLKGDRGFTKLKMSEAEVIGIDSILTQRDIATKKFMNVHGTEESFMSMSGRSPDLILISTHGFYYSPQNVPAWSSLNGYDNPMYLTGLVMSGGNAEYLKRSVPDGVMGGLLTSSDIAGLDLSGTQMVVLSACETGLGETTNEGVYGLQRAFKKAGAQTLVMSLWPVSDMATTDFMILFHSQLADSGWDKREAFRKAKASFRTRYPEPYDWAAFIMID